MSEYLKSAVVTASASLEDSIKIFKHNLENLCSSHDFEFRGGYGGVERLDFIDAEYFDSTPIDHPGSTSDLDDTTLESLLKQHHWIQVVGTIRFPDSVRLYDAALGLCPVAKDGHACVFSHLDASLYNDVWPDEDDIDHVDHAAAEKLRSLAIMLGAHPLTDGFCTQNVVAIEEIVTFDGERLKDSFENPRSVAEKWKNRKHLRHGCVSGIKRELCDIEVMRTRGEGCDIFETITGHIVVSTLVDIDPSWYSED